MNTDPAYIPESLTELDAFLSERESALNLKPGTEADIAWNCDQPFQKTDYAIVYLHGFRASHPEGEPVHHRVAEHLGCNLYLSRLQEHGIDSEYPLLNLTEEKLLQSARFAFHIGQQIGHKVILMGTSTGASLALWLASRDEIKDKISALILYSPLIRFYGLTAQLLMNTFSRSLLEVIPGKTYLVKTKGTTYAEDRIWNKKYALQGALALGAFVEHHMQNKTFANVECPVWTGYYYKNRQEQDRVVSVPSIKKMVSKLGTRSELVSATNFPEADNHVICSSLLSRSVEAVTDTTINFLKTVVSQRAREK